jgi:RNA polymerase sigma-70 factor (ECF subfamily)
MAAKNAENGSGAESPAKRVAARNEGDELARAVGEVASEDARLVAAAQEGDRKAFGRLFEKYRGAAYQIAYRFLGRREDALDVVQDAFGKAFRALRTFRGGSGFKTWFFRVVTNRALDARRSRGVRQAGSLDAAVEPADRRPDSGPSRQAETQELKARLEAALEAVPETNRTAFVLFAVGELSYREIAEVLNISIGTVMSRIFYARRKLQAVLSGETEAGAGEN